MSESRIEVRTIWGECYTTDCAEVGLRCRWGYCPNCCERKHRNTDGTLRHDAWTQAQIDEQTPKYQPQTPTLVGEMTWEEVA